MGMCFGGDGERFGYKSQSAMVWHRACNSFAYSRPYEGAFWFSGENNAGSVLFERGLYAGRKLEKTAGVSGHAYFVDCIEKRHSDAHMVGFDSGARTFLISYPFSKFTKGIVLGAGVVLVFALAILIGKLTNFFGGLIALFVGTYLADTLSQSMCKWLHLESDLVGLLYILRIIGGVMGIILLCWAVAGIRDNRKNVQRIANALNAAASLKQLAEECHEAAETICAPLIREEIPEIAAMRAKMIYQKADQWAFQRVKGSAEESWGDALEMQTELLAMCDYYADMLEMTKK